MTQAAYFGIFNLIYNQGMEAVLLIGIQAVGKTTFYQQRLSHTHVRISLDLLKTRHREFAFLQTCIQTLQPFVVDNTNILLSERAHYISLAKAAGYAVHGYYFQSSLKAALVRNQQRTGKSRVPDVGVITKFARLQLPTYAEGFDRLCYVSFDHQGGFTVEDWRDLPPSGDPPES